MYPQLKELKVVTTIEEQTSAIDRLKAWYDAISKLYLIRGNYETHLYRSGEKPIKSNTIAIVRRITNNQSSCV